MSPFSPFPTTGAPWTLAFQLQSAWLAQMASWQSAWFESMLEMQRRSLGGDWATRPPWMPGVGLFAAAAPRA